MSQFNTVNLTGDRVLVKGTDRFGAEGETVLYAGQWNSVKRHRDFHDAEAAFDNTVEEFFAPLMEAADKLQSALSTPKPDPDTYVVLSEGAEGQAAKAPEVVHLDHDAVILRLIERGDTDRLVWVMGQLEVMQVQELPVDEAKITEDDGIPEQREG